MSFTIRHATPQDSPDVVRVIKAVYDEFGFSWDEEDYHADLYDLQTHYMDAGHRFWVAETDAGIVGTVALELFPPFPGEKGTLQFHGDNIHVCGADCSLERLYVLPEARKIGLGRALMQQVVDQAKQERRSLMEIWSDKNFKDAHQLYQKFGATVVGDRICNDPDQAPEWGLILPLK